MKRKEFFSIPRITRIAVLAAVAFVLMFFEFPLLFIAPNFYKLDFSELPVIIGGFAMGPLAAVVIELLKILLKLLFRGTSTAFVGEFANFVVGCAFALPASALYFRKKCKAQALKGLLLGSLCMALAGFLLNLYVVIPAYVNIMGFPLEAIISAGAAIFPAVDSVFMLVLLCTTPFNLIKAALLSVLTLLLYKHVSPLLH